jgi:hypothetical protein
MVTQVGEAVSAWEDLGPTQRLNSFAPPPQPSAKSLEIMGKLGLRYPPANSVDRDSHAARVALLAEDCADLPDEWLDEAAREWAKAEPFFPRACELREKALNIGRRQTRALPAPLPMKTVRPIGPPLTEDEIKDLPPAIIDMGVKLGEIDPDVVAKLRDQAA